jgi:tRNA A37 threonylcarbamoyladenosine dehydratase
MKQPTAAIRMGYSRQESLGGKRDAIAGMGGVSGFHLMTLTRVDIGAFDITDFNHFELANLNGKRAPAFMPHPGTLPLTPIHLRGNRVEVETATCFNA